MFIVNPDIMSKIDKQTTKKFGIDSLMLMENAGVSVANHITENYPFRNILILCGPGNNGGDGFVVARHLFNKNYNIKIGILSKNGKYIGDALKNFSIIKKMKIPYFNAFNQTKILRESLKESDILIDAIFGIGFSGQIRNSYIPIFKMLKKQKKPIISVDIPSGINGLTGEVGKYAITAETTIAFAAIKTGLLWNEALINAGNLFVSDISVPNDLIASYKHSYLLDRDTVNLLKNDSHFSSKPYSHKMQKGKILIIGGNEGMQGAPQMSAISALKTSSGISYIYLLKKGGRRFYPETVFIDDYKKMMKKCNAIVIGPGLGTDEKAKEILINVLLNNDNVIIDADAINILSKMSKGVVKKLIKGKILTPHPEEFKRISGFSFSNMQEKIEKAEIFAKKNQLLLVLKSPPTIITDGKTTFVFPFMSDKLATAGSGDILAGIMGGLLSSGIDMFQSTLISVYIHFLSAIKTKGMSVSANEIIKNLPLTCKEIFQ